MVAGALLAKKDLIIDKIDPRIIKNEINVLKKIGVQITKKKNQ
jgi:UDP-N-acetylglucosamine enolpyruvyl transferase